MVLRPFYYAEVRTFYEYSIHHSIVQNSLMTVRLSEMRFLLANPYAKFLNICYFNPFKPIGSCIKIRYRPYIDKHTII
jgi:hypothetical protein